MSVAVAFTGVMRLSLIVLLTSSVVAAENMALKRLQKIC